MRGLVDDVAALAQLGARVASTPFSHTDDGHLSPAGPL